MKKQFVKVRGRELPVCEHSACEHHRIWDLPTCAVHLSQAEREGLQGRVIAALRGGGGNLKGVVLTGTDLRGIDLSEADLAGTLLDHCDLRGCRFVDADLSGACLGWARLDHADLTRTDINGAVFSEARLPGVKLLAYSLVVCVINK